MACAYDGGWIEACDMFLDGTPDLVKTQGNLLDHDLEPIHPQPSNLLQAAI